MTRFLPALLALLLAACATLPPHLPVPKGEEGKAVVEGYTPRIRSWGDEAPERLEDSIAKRIAQYKESQAEYFRMHGHYPPMQYLALSGGAYDGAFGAGLLSGWSAAGTRPEFTIVTGVSTGALIAPFAFLGPEYDGELKRVFTTTASDGIIEGTLGTFFEGITGGLAVADNSPLERQIEESVTPEMFSSIAAEHRKGRRLLIGTTNMEAERSVIWDIGSIANAGNPRGLELFRRILLASAAVPGVVKPVFIDVTLEGKTYSEIHVDGGVTAQVFLYPLHSTSRESALFRESGIPRQLFIIRNAKITPDYKPMQPGLLAITQRSLETLIKSQGLGDLYRLYVGAKRDGIDYNLAYMPPEFSLVPTEFFDPAYMSSLFELGYRMGKEGTHWQKSPPGVAYMDEAALTPPPRP